MQVIEWVTDFLRPGGACPASLLRAVRNARSQNGPDILSVIVRRKGDSMRRDLTHAELKIHSKLWLLAQNQKLRKVKYDPTLLTKGWREGWDEIKGWLAPAFTRRLDARLTRPERGFCVAYRETQNSFGMEGLKKAIIHAEDVGEGIVGGWYRQKDGKFYFDSVRLHANLATAVQSARINGQYGIYDLSKDVYIPVKLKGSISAAILEAQKSRNILL